MLKSLSDPRLIQKQFSDINQQIMRLMTALAQGRDVPSAVGEVSQVAEMVSGLEKLVNAQAKVRQNQLAELMKIGRAINSSLGLKRVLEEVMDSLIKLMRAERGFLMLRESDGELSVRVARGIAHSDLDRDDFAFSKTVVRNAVEAGLPVLTTNALADPRFQSQMSVAGYQFRSIMCAPLKLRNELIGVIYVDHRTLSDAFQESDKELVSAFADQAAIAIDNARLIESLKRTNEELEHANADLENAYQATLEGWVRALDLRDKETEGHTQRVTILTERLARRLGVSGDDLIHLTRGALLHDIGKMAIPDGILLKPGALTADERALINKHPQYAYEMLHPIEFLRPALDIPYCHHEKWDGSGYPRKLKGEQIPFHARIFPVIDVWDALVSDRPYRKGLPPDEVRARIQADAGSHFDPQVVDAFLAMGDMSV